MATDGAALAFGAPLINLMPRAELERRARGTLIRRWGWGLVVALAVVALLGAGAFSLRVAAEVRLMAENARTTALLERISELADVRSAVLLERELTGFGEQAMAADIDWPGLVAKLGAVTPEGVTMVGFDLSSGAIPIGEDPTSEIGVVGTFSFESLTPVEIVPLIRAVRPLAGVMEADGWEGTSEDESGTRIYTYVLRVSVDQSVYTNAHRQEPAE